MACVKIKKSPHCKMWIVYQELQSTQVYLGSYYSLSNAKDNHPNAKYN